MDNLTMYSSEGLSEAAFFIRENYPRGLYQGNIDMLRDIHESSSKSFLFHVYLEVGLLTSIVVIYIGHLFGLLLARRKELSNEFQEISLLSMISKDDSSKIVDRTQRFGAILRDEMSLNLLGINVQANHFMLPGNEESQDEEMDEDDQDDLFKMGEDALMDNIDLYEENRFNDRSSLMSEENEEENQMKRNSDGFKLTVQKNISSELLLPEIEEMDGTPKRREGIPSFDPSPKNSKTGAAALDPRKGESLRLGSSPKHSKNGKSILKHNFKKTNISNQKSDSKSPEHFGDSLVLLPNSPEIKQNLENGPNPEIESLKPKEIEGKKPIIVIRDSPRKEKKRKRTKVDVVIQSLKIRNSESKKNRPQSPLSFVAAKKIMKETLGAKFIKENKVDLEMNIKRILKEGLDFSEEAVDEGKSPLQPFLPSNENWKRPFFIRFLLAIILVLSPSFFSLFNSLADYRSYRDISDHFKMQNSLKLEAGMMNLVALEVIDGGGSFVVDGK